MKIVVAEPNAFFLFLNAPSTADTKKATVNQFICAAYI